MSAVICYSSYRKLTPSLIFTLSLHCNCECYLSFLHVSAVLDTYYACLISVVCTSPVQRAAENVGWSAVTTSTGSGGCTPIPISRIHSQKHREMHLELVPTKSVSLRRYCSFQLLSSPLFMTQDGAHGKELPVQFHSLTSLGQMRNAGAWASMAQVFSKIFNSSSSEAKSVTEAALHCGWEINIFTRRLSNKLHLPELRQESQKVVLG